MENGSREIILLHRFKKGKKFMKNTKNHIHSVHNEVYHIFTCDDDGHSQE